ncbi:hypothetical protein Goari_018729 [Gossypium aridum]|uniref:CCHC-type domain-containing protein n=1 Tax=Gossypium aridum TaxID=34290 RepID=A0A7J8WRL4_GOSAI|nr:hypothetical protein [Gossypium aridum]
MGEMFLVTNFGIGVNLVGSNAGIGCATKKVRWQPNLLPDIDDPTVDENGRKLLEAIMAKVSYKNTRVGFSTTSDSSRKVEDFELQKGDVTTKMVDRLPSLKGSQRYNSKHPFQLMDLENDYYLARFNDEEDHNNVLTNGPWVIFGQYLIVRPWSLTFSTSQNEVDTQVVWVRLPGLPEGYYSNYILRAIGNLRYQKLELMGECNELSINLYPNVCFRCGLYGHSFHSCPKNRPSLPMNDIAHSSLILEIHDLQRRVEDQNYGLWMLVQR